MYCHVFYVIIKTRWRIESLELFWLPTGFDSFMASIAMAQRHGRDHPSEFKHTFIGIHT